MKIRTDMNNPARLNKDIVDWIKSNVPKNPPEDNTGYGRCITYAGALAKLFNGTLIKGFNTKMMNGDYAHFWVTVDGIDYDPTGHWYSGGINYNGVKISMSKNKSFFDSDPVYQILISQK
jgi:hypothetical protein